MNLVKIGDTYVNKDYVTGIRVSPFKTERDALTIFIDFVNGRTLIVQTTDIGELDGIAKKLVDSEIIECARKIKEYCAERAYGRCESCALYNNGCFVGKAYKDELTDSYDVDSPLDWEV